MKEIEISPASAELIKMVRDFEKDHAPEGYPAIKMSDLKRMADKIEEIENLFHNCLLFEADTELYIEKVAAKYLSAEYIDKEYNGEYVCIESLVDELAKLIPDDKLLKEKK